MGIMGRVRQYVTDANDKARRDMGKVRAEWESDSARHRADMAAARERRVKGEGQPPADR